MLTYKLKKSLAKWFFKLVLLPFKLIAWLFCSFMEIVIFFGLMFDEYILVDDNEGIFTKRERKEKLRNNKIIQLYHWANSDDNKSGALSLSDEE